MDEGIAFNPLPDVYTASVCGVESGQLGLLSKVVSVTNKARLWHCESHLSTAKTTDAKAVLVGECFAKRWLAARENARSRPWPNGNQSPPARVFQDGQQDVFCAFLTKNRTL